MTKAKDYSESANICNPPEVEKILDELAVAEASLQTLEEELRSSNKALVKKIATQSEKVAELRKSIREAIEEHGSYQDTEKERYAVKYRSRKKVYNLGYFKSHFPKFVDLCIKEAIDVTALEGQIKGKLITVEQLEAAEVLTYEEYYSFYVRP